MLPVTSTRPERRRFMSGRKACSVRTVPATFTSSTDPTAPAVCASSGPIRPRPALHTEGREIGRTLPASLSSDPAGSWASGHFGLDTVPGRLLHACCGEAHPARPRGPRSRVPGQRPQNPRPSRPAATSPGSQEGTLGTGLPPTAGPAPSGPAAWHTLEVQEEDEYLNSLLPAIWSPWPWGCSFLSIPASQLPLKLRDGSDARRRARCRPMPEEQPVMSTTVRSMGRQWGEAPGVGVHCSRLRSLSSLI